KRVVLLVTALTVGGVAPVQAQHPWFWKGKACPLCPPPAAPADLTAPPKVLPPQTMPPMEEPSLRPVTTAALGFGSASFAAPNMFGDNFGGASVYKVTVLDSFSFNGTAFLVGSPSPANFTNTTPITTARGTVIPAGNTFQSVETFKSPTDPPPQTLTMQDNATVRGIIVAPLPPGTTTLLAGTGNKTFSSSANNIAAFSIFPGSQYDIFYQYQHEVLLNLPNPSQGGVVGRAKISEDNYP